MKITLNVSGGFAPVPALNRSFLADTAKVDPQIARELESLVRQARFFDQPAQLNTAAPGAADYRTYAITVQDGSRTHTVELTDPITDAAFERLVSRIQSVAGRQTP
jgi:hypothetical protein